MINKGGMTYWVPVSDRETTTVDSIEKWEQAFRVYSKIYCKFNPTRSQELVEYSFIIHSISKMFAWRNVYSYDKLFRTHMAKHPQRNWGIILQQAWSFCLTEKIGHTVNQTVTPSTGGGSDHMKKRKKICFDYNAGYCSYGFGCKFEHRCGICGKFGHGAHVCRRINNDSRDKQKYGRSGKDRWNDKSWKDNDKNRRNVDHESKQK